MTEPMDRARWTCSRCGRRQRAGYRSDPHMPVGWRRQGLADSVTCRECVAWALEFRRRVKEQSK